MKVVLALALVVGVELAGSARAATSREVQYGPIPAWVSPVPAPTTTTASPAAPVRVAYYDTQDRIGTDGEEVFTAYRVKILKPEALSAGNIGLTWSPSAGTATVHYLRIIRDGAIIDVLRTTKFEVIQRENGLERSMLDGLLTATLQTPGLQVGDEIEFAGTIRRRDPTLGDHAFGVNQLPPQGLAGAFRYRLLWPEQRRVTVRASRDLPSVVPTVTKDEASATYELRDPTGVVLTDGAPSRFNVRRLIEYSDFGAWRDVSRSLSPLFDKAATLQPKSPIRAEVARIAALTTDPAARAQAALQLVQERIRYVYVGLNGGNYTPASADETWQRRFGDCKGKTALLLALLRELGVRAEAVLVNSGGGDGTNEHLPNPSLFDHILVRATIGGRAHWLDGTRLGDMDLAALPPPTFRWALPLSSAGNELEAVSAQPFALPQFIDVVDIDATAGYEKAAKLTVRRIVRGLEAYQIRTQLSAMSGEDTTRALTSFWRQQIDWAEASDVAWRYDEKGAVLTLSLTGQGKPEWKGDDRDGHNLVVYGAGFVPPDKMIRPKEQDQAAPWTTEFPRYRCWATTIHLPAPGAKRAWTYEAGAVNRVLGGVAYYRRAGLRDGVLRTVMSRQVLVPEISAAEAQDVNAKIAGFNNNMSTVSEDATTGARVVAKEVLPFADGADWYGSASPCTPPAATK